MLWNTTSNQLLSCGCQYTGTTARYTPWVCTSYNLFGLWNNNTKQLPRAVVLGAHPISPMHLLRAWYTVVHATRERREAMQLSPCRAPHGWGQQHHHQKKKDWVRGSRNNYNSWLFDPPVLRTDSSETQNTKKCILLRYYVSNFIEKRSWRICEERRLTIMMIHLLLPLRHSSSIL